MSTVNCFLMSRSEVKINRCFRCIKSCNLCNQKLNRKHHKYAYSYSYMYSPLSIPYHIVYSTIIGKNAFQHVFYFQECLATLQLLKCIQLNCKTVL